MKKNSRRRILGALLAVLVMLLVPVSANASGSGQAVTLEQMYGNLKGSTRGYEAVKARISGNTLTIDLYVNFTGAYNAKIDGQACAALARKGFSLWAGAYAGSKWDFRPGMQITVKVVIRDIYNGAGRIPGQNYFDFVCRADLGRSFTCYSTGYYNRELLGTNQGAIPNRSYTNGAIVMHAGLSGRYTANQYTKIAAHELGHVLGLGDQYGKGAPVTAECPGGTKYAKGDIMGAHGQVTANNIEMFLEAYRTGWYQAYVNSHPEVKSKAIRSY